MSIRLISLLTLLSAGLASCGITDKDGDDSGSTDADGGGEGGGSGGDDGDESGDDGGTGDGLSPTIIEADSWCFEHTKSESTYLWMATATVDDPQGLDTMESFFEGVTVSMNDVEVATYSMVCTDGGDCTTSWNQTEDNIACSNAEAYVISIMVSDEDGNWSDSVEITGRMGTSAEGR